MKILLERTDANHNEWLALKEKRIGSSQIGTICGLNSFKTPLQLWAEMTGKAPKQPVNDYMWLGSETEPIIGKLFARRTGMMVQPASVLVQHPTEDWAIASPDFFVLQEKVKKLLETKNVNWRSMRRWENGPPDEHVVQLNWQMGICGIEQGFIAGLLGGSPDDFVHEPFDYSRELFDMCLEQAGEFLQCIQKDIPPTAGAADVKLIESMRTENPAIPPELVFVGEEAQAIFWADALEKANAEKTTLNEQLKLQKELSDEARANLLLLLGDAQQGLLPDGRIVNTSKINFKEKFTPPYSYTKVTIKNGETKHGKRNNRNSSNADYSRANSTSGTEYE